MAGKTQGVKLASMVIVLPWHDPMRIAPSRFPSPCRSWPNSGGWALGHSAKALRRREARL